MPLKIILLYDSSNNPLQVEGIRVELFDAVRGGLLQARNSADLNPKRDGRPSTDWGVELDFPLGSSPLDIYITDPLYRYPGNTVRYLNGRLQDRIYIDVLHLPMVTSSRVAAPVSVQPLDLSQWVEEHSDWDADQRDAVRNLLFNYMAIIARPDRLESSKPMSKVKDNWEKALQRLGFPIDMFEKTPTSSKSNPPSAQLNWKADTGPAQAARESSLSQLMRRFEKIVPTDRVKDAPNAPMATKEILYGTGSQISPSAEKPSAAPKAETAKH